MAGMEQFGGGRAHNHPIVGRNICLISWETASILCATKTTKTIVTSILAKSATPVIIDDPIPPTVPHRFATDAPNPYCCRWLDHSAWQEANWLTSSRSHGYRQLSHSMQGFPGKQTVASLIFQEFEQGSLRMRRKCVSKLSYFHLDWSFLPVDLYFKEWRHFSDNKWRSKLLLGLKEMMIF